MKRGVTSLVIVLALVISVASVVNLVNFKETPVAGEIGLSPYGYNPYASGGYNPSAPIGPTSCDSDVDCDEGEFCSPIDPNNRFCLPESLVIHYDFEDLGLGPSSSGLVDNIAGSSYDGNLIGGMFSNPSGGVQGDYLKLSGTNEHVDIPYQLDYGRSFSISVWARPDTLDMNQWERNIITDRPGGRPWVDIFLSKRNRFGFFLWDDPVDARSASTIQGGSARVNEWSHIVGVYEVTGAIDSNSWNVDTTLYVNGEKINTKSTSVTEGGLSNLNIGRGVTNQRFFDGGIDEVKIFNYPLDGEEVQDLFGERVVECSDSDSEESLRTGMINEGETVEIGDLSILLWEAYPDYVELRVRDLRRPRDTVAVIMIPGAMAEASISGIPYSFEVYFVADRRANIDIFSTMNYYAAGEITGDLVSTPGFNYDSCLNGVELREMFCNAEGLGEPRHFDCPNGCVNGKCNWNAPPHSFEFEIYPNKVKVEANLETSPVNFGILYGDGNQFLSYGDDGDQRLIISEDEGLTFDKDNSEHFIASGTSEDESYLMRATNFRVPGDGTERVTFQYKDNFVWTNAKTDAKVGDDVVLPSGNVRFSVTAVDSISPGRSVTVDAYPNTEFNYLFDENGYFIKMLMGPSTFPADEISFIIYDRNAQPVETHRFYWDGGIIVQDIQS
tara:strand:- start:4 stop:2013 length:2010 start_codon:yes stop_codon:yes gene_type:complete